MNASLGFDKEAFQRSEGVFYKYLKQSVVEGAAYVVALRTDSPFFYVVEWAKCLLVFKMEPEEFVFKKKLFRKEEKLDWKRLRRIAKNTLEMSNTEIQQSDVRITTLTLHEILGRYMSGDFTNDLRLQFRDAHIEKVFAKKFELDQHSSYIQLRKILQEADIDDPLYNEIKFAAQRSKQSYHKTAKEFSQELVEFHNRLRGNKQLSALSQLTS